MDFKSLFNAWPGHFPDLSSVFCNFSDSLLGGHWRYSWVMWCIFMGTEMAALEYSEDEFSDV